MDDLLPRILATRSRRSKHLPYPAVWFGDFIGVINGKDCWWETDSEGSAKTAWEELGPGIATLLERYCQRVPGSGWITFALYMIGRTKDTASPTVMFFHHETATRKDAMSIIRKSDLLKQYPGFKVGHCKEEPGLKDMQLLAGCQYEFIQEAESESSSLVFYDPKQPMGRTGLRIYSKIEEGASVSVQSARATIVVHNNQPRCLSVSHIFSSNQPAQQHATECTEEYEIASDSEDEYSENDDTEITSRGSLTPETTSEYTLSDGDCPDDRSERSFASTSEETTFRFPEYLHRAESSVQPDGFEELGSAPHSKLPEHPPAERRSLSPTHRPSTQSTPGCLVPFGRVLKSSTDKDWALIEITNREALTRLKADDAEHRNVILPKAVSKPESSAEVVVNTPSGGKVAGKLCGTPAYSRLPNGSSYQQVYRVRLDGIAVKGDCGSPVMDARTHELYGYIFAGSESTGVVYILPAQDVFADIEYQLGGQLSLVPQACGCFPGSGSSESDDSSAESRKSSPSNVQDGPDPELCEIFKVPGPLDKPDILLTQDMPSPAPFPGNCPFVRFLTMCPVTYPDVFADLQAIVQKYRQPELLDRYERWKAENPITPSLNSSTSTAPSQGTAYLCPNADGNVLPNYSEFGSPFRCPTCVESFKTKDDLRKHLLARTENQQHRYRPKWPSPRDLSLQLPASPTQVPHPYTVDEDPIIDLDESSIHSALGPLRRQSLDMDPVTQHSAARQERHWRESFDMWAVASPLLPMRADRTGESVRDLYPGVSRRAPYQGRCFPECEPHDRTTSNLGSSDNRWFGYVRELWNFRSLPFLDELTSCRSTISSMAILALLKRASLSVVLIGIFTMIQCELNFLPALNILRMWWSLWMLFIPFRLIFWLSWPDQHQAVSAPLGTIAYCYCVGSVRDHAEELELNCWRRTSRSKVVLLMVVFLTAATGGLTQGWQNASFKGAAGLVFYLETLLGQPKFLLALLTIYTWALPALDLIAPLPYQSPRWFQTTKRHNDAFQSLLAARHTSVSGIELMRCLFMIESEKASHGLANGRPGRRLAKRVRPWNRSWVSGIITRLWPPLRATVRLCSNIIAVATERAIRTSGFAPILDGLVIITQYVSASAWYPVHPRQTRPTVLQLCVRAYVNVVMDPVATLFSLYAVVLHGECPPIRDSMQSDILLRGNRSESVYMLDDTCECDGGSPSIGRSSRPIWSIFGAKIGLRRGQRSVNLSSTPSIVPARVARFMKMIFWLLIIFAAVLELGI